MIPKLQLPAAAPSRRRMFLSVVCMAATRTVWFSLHLDWHRSAVSFSALNVSPLTKTIASLWGLYPCFNSPICWGQVLTLLYFPLIPSSYWVLPGSIYSFLLVRYLCPLSAGVLHASLCLKVCSWCICVERCTPHPPTPLTACPLLSPYFLSSKSPLFCTALLELKFSIIHLK